MKNPLQTLLECGQSIWLDHLSRNLITGGELKRLIDEDGIRGLTSNPTILEKAIAGSSDYRDILEAPESQEIDAKTLYELMAVRDIQEAADILHSVYLESRRHDGYVSLEVSPQLAHDSQSTLEEARRLWQMVARENLMIKIPGTPEGIGASKQLISEGINVNVTLLFTREIYEQAAAAYLDGLEILAGKNGDLSKIAGVASIFISRVDTAIDDRITAELKISRNPEDQVRLRSLFGKVAIAGAKIIYQKYLNILQEDRWQNLNRLGAQPQRLLWASTGTKNPQYSDVLYVEELIGQNTVNTAPPATIEAFRDHGHVRLTLTENVEEALGIMELVEQVGIPFKDITDKLLDDGLKQFADAFGKLLTATDRRNKVSDDDPTTFLRIILFKELYTGQHPS